MFAFHLLRAGNCQPQLVVEFNRKKDRVVLPLQSGVGIGVVEQHLRDLAKTLSFPGTSEREHILVHRAPLGDGEPLFFGRAQPESEQI